MQIITVANQKGGVGKTSTTECIATCLTRYHGKKVLVVDADPQQNLSLPLWDNMGDIPTLYAVFKGIADIKDTIYHTEDYDVIRGGLELSMFDLEFNAVGREYLLKKALQKLKYDVILIDSPPTLGGIVVNSLTCCNHLIIPITPDKYAIAGLGQLVQVVELVKEYNNPSLDIAGIVTTKVTKDSATRVVLSQMDGIAESIGTKAFESTIRNGVIIRKCQDLGVNLFDAEPNCGLAKDYKALTEEIIKTIGLE